MARPWFDVQWPEADTAVISEPLHWEQPHCYLLLGTQRALLIDTGLGVGGLAAQVEALTDLPVLAAITHAHWDHIGGLGGFAPVSYTHLQQGQHRAQQHGRVQPIRHVGAQE